MVTQNTLTADFHDCSFGFRPNRSAQDAVGEWEAFYSVGYPSRAFRRVNHYMLLRMARFLNRKSQRRYRLKFADTYYGELDHMGLYWLKWAHVRTLPKSS